MIRVCHLYPDLLNLYGDRGNVIAFRQRCQWRDLPVYIHSSNLGERVDFSKYDFVFLGGGSDREQTLISADLMQHRDEFAAAIEGGLVVLAICGGYQLLGSHYLSPGGENIPGLGILDFYTKAGDQRLVGNVVVEMELNSSLCKVVGFENHSGATFLGDVRPLGKVLAGNGNNGRDGLEGVRYKNVFGSYLHGPLLPKNVRLTDHLIGLCLERRGLKNELKPLDDSLENRACEVMLSRLGLFKR